MMGVEEFSSTRGSTSNTPFQSIISVMIETCQTEIRPGQVDSLFIVRDI